MSNTNPISVMARVKNQAREIGVDNQTALNMYIMERFLVRIYASNCSQFFVIKGGVLMYMAYGAVSRVTRDIDMTFRQQNTDRETLVECLNNIMTTSYDDCVTFDLNSLRIRDSQIDHVIPGFAVKVDAYLGQSKFTMNFDISYGDQIYPYSQTINLTPILEENSIPLTTYPFETVLAEKFCASLSFLADNTRLKDFYDIYLITSTRNFYGPTVQTAVYQTIMSRIPEIFNSVSYEQSSFSFVADLHARFVGQWNLFIAEIPSPNVSDFSHALLRYSDFFYPMWSVMLEGKEFDYSWDCHLHRWI
jgi:predicted nucleotidyltransferase component of viral defense system